MERWDVNTGHLWLSTGKKAKRPCKWIRGVPLML